MSLLDEAMETCTLYNKSTVRDGYGGYKDVYTKGVEFEAAIVLDSSIEARRAEQEGVTAVYTVTTRKTLNLQYHAVFERNRDGKIFRVKSDGDDKLAPQSASLNMRQVAAEEWEIPADGQVTSN